MDAFEAGRIQGRKDAVEWMQHNSQSIDSLYKMGVLRLELGFRMGILPDWRKR